MKNNLFITIIMIFFHTFLCIDVNAEIIRHDENNLISSLSEPLTTKLAPVVEETYPFYGLASYYNFTNYYVVRDDSLKKINENELILKDDKTLAVVGRFKLLLIDLKNLPPKSILSDLSIEITQSYLEKNSYIKLLNKSDLTTLDPILNQIRYYHLWTPLAILARIIERSLIFIENNISHNWALAIVCFSIFLKILLLPVSIITIRIQNNVSRIQSTLQPQIEEIKNNYSGEKAHMKLMQAHKNAGVSPFYALKPLFGSFIQVPILIATFNVLGEMPQFNMQSFLWINNLAYPDYITTLPTHIPLIGNKISLLPILMTVITLLSTITYENKHAPKIEIKRQKRNLYIMAFTFLILFYPFPAAMVLYWALANILQFIQQHSLKI